ncbi:MAG: DNA polymerase/3'-5' exonuclease PolX, partial [Candidatus Thorarchaeota archaeon]
MIKNKEVARALKEIALLLEVEGKDKYKPRAYLRAVRSITALGEDIEDIAERGELIEIPGVGKAISTKIESFLETGTIKLLEKLRKQIPVKVMELESIPSVGPKTIKLVYDQLKVTDLDSLETAALEGKIAELKGMGSKTQQQIIEGIKLIRSGLSRTLLSEAMFVANRFKIYLQNNSKVKQIALAGSLRRRRETVGDIDILVVASDEADISATFVNFEDVAEIIVQGPTKSSVRLENNMQVDLRVLPPESFGAGLQYFTGSKDHNVKLRSIALKKKMRLNEYGLFKGETKIAGDDEKSIYTTLDLDYIPPELREDQGEIEAAQEGRLPKLVNLEDIRGDLHSHTDQSDGHNTLEEMLDAAAEKGYDYYCVSDHTQSLTITNGMDETRLLARIEEIDELNASGRWNMKILKGAEVDILADGSLDIEDEVLAQLDVVTVSVHSRMKDSKEKMTERVSRALENKYVHILGHPTGRLIGRRSEFEIDLGTVFEIAEKNNIAMELNSYPSRLDLNAMNLRAAIGKNLKIAINTDAHR